MSDTLTLLQSLVQRHSVTPDDAGCQLMIAQRLQALGFVAESLNFADTQNLWLRRGTTAPLFVFLGHTDVVPSGPVEAWQSPPFEPTIRDGKLYGRGTADMKGGIACFISAVERFIQRYPQHHGSIAILLTSDEEGAATNGIVKVVEVLQQRQQPIEWCLVGEPSSQQQIGDMIRVGRRGSLSADLRIFGIQGHVAYPHLADNPIHRSLAFLQQLTTESWDQGNAFFPPTRLQISNIHAGTGADNVIPGQLDITFNLRFSSELTESIIKQRVETLLTQSQLNYQIHWRLSGQPFLTTKGQLIQAATQAIQQICGIQPVCDTGGGTSDGRFIAPTGAQVIELGLRNETIHKIDEHVYLKDIEILSEIYELILEKLLTSHSSIHP
ncbi:MAG: hypothetical protein RL637_104 [Pseudomonadota bacterium]|jgi:succinyl-diaminopimelate desuccinylase